MKKILRLAIGLALLWLTVYVAGPFMLRNIEPLRKFAEAANQENIHPGALYYTDVPVSRDAETNSRNASH